MIQTRSAPSCLIKNAVVELERKGSGSVHDAAAEIARRCHLNEGATVHESEGRGTAELLREVSNVEQHTAKRYMKQPHLNKAYNMAQHHHLAAATLASTGSLDAMQLPSAMVVALTQAQAQDNPSSSSKLGGLLQPEDTLSSASSSGSSCTTTSNHARDPPLKVKPRKSGSSKHLQQTWPPPAGLR